MVVYFTMLSYNRNEILSPRGDDRYGWIQLAVGVLVL
jgi:hypothetical protein